MHETFDLHICLFSCYDFVALRTYPICFIQTFYINLVSMKYIYIFNGFAFLEFHTAEQFNINIRLPLWKSNYRLGVSSFLQTLGLWYSLYEVVYSVYRFLLKWWTSLLYNSNIIFVAITISTHTIMIKNNISTIYFYVVLVVAVYA